MSAAATGQERKLSIIGSYLSPYEDKLLRTPIPQHRAVLAEMGAPLTAETCGSDAQQPGIMRIR